MSRQSSNKYKISNPTLLPSSQLPSAYASDSSPYPSFVKQSRPLNPPEQHRNNGPPPSPARPARSRMRDASQQQRRSRDPNSDSRRNLIPPVQTSGGSTYDGYDIPPVSPISPVSPATSSQNFGQNISLSSDVFAADRSQRMELRAQVSAAAHQASQPFQKTDPTGAESDKMRNVVGAFMSAGRHKEDTSAPRRPGRSEARAKRPPREEKWDEEASSEGSQFGELDVALRKVRKHWPFVVDSDFSASSLALSLLSKSPSPSLPSHPGLSSFLRLHESLTSGLRAVVQAHSKSFASSLPAHQNFLSTLENAQEQVRRSKTNLLEAREGFAGRTKTELAGIRARERTVRDMLKILDTIDYLKQVPDQLEAFIGDKRFLQAALILVRSLKTINRPELSEIGALSDLRSYFTSQETTLTEILVEELQNHIYLKNLYSDSRWRPYTPGQVNLPIPELEVTELSSNLNKNGTNATPGPGPSSRFSRYIAQLIAKPSIDPNLSYYDDFFTPPPPTLPIVSQAKSEGGSGIGQTDSYRSVSLTNGIITNGSRSAFGDTDNPETDSYTYIETLLEALAAMGRLGQALDMVAQRVPAELHALIEITLDEVESRSEQHREEVDFATRPMSLLAAPDNTHSAVNSNGAKSLFAPTEMVRIEVSLGAASPPQHTALLNDLFWTLYSKLAAVLEGHRVIYEVSRWISTRKDFKDSTISFETTSLTIPILEMWKPVQNEVKMLLSDYLTDDQQGSTLHRHTILSVNEVLRGPKLTRSRSRQMFKFSEGDTRAVQKEIKMVDDAIQQALRSSVPGLVSLQIDQLTSFTEADDQFSGKYRVLVPPNPFNVTTLFQPTLSFINRAIAIIPPGFEEETRGFSTVLEDFVAKVFLPQLDEKVTAGFQQAVSGYDAYQIDRAMMAQLKQPPLKSSVRVMSLIHILCNMLRTTPFHRENYSRLIIGVIVQYYQQCSTRFRELVSLPTTLENASERPLALPAVWAQHEDIIKCLSQMRAVSNTDPSRMAIHQREISLEVELLHNQPVPESQLINSQRKLEALGHLSRSLRWFIDSLLELQTVAEKPVSSNDEPPKLDDLAMTPPVPTDLDGPRLPLTQAMAQRYQAILQTYEQMAEMVVNTIRLEIRCRVNCNLAASMQKGDLRLESEALEPDSDVVNLNSILMSTEEVAERTIAPDDHSFIFKALGHLVDHCLITGACKYVKSVNAAGVRHIKRNIRSLQQTLRGTAAREGVLTLSMAYWNLFEKGAKDMLEELKSMDGRPPFSFEDYNTMLKLQCMDDTDELNTYLIDLHALSMCIEGWDIGED
nr:exocyst complex component 4 [Cryptococcus depauperatus CBS 7855]